MSKKTKSTKNDKMIDAAVQKQLKALFGENGCPEFIIIQAEQDSREHYGMTDKVAHAPVYQCGF
jgi:hypothetical protein